MRLLEIPIIELLVKKHKSTNNRTKKLQITELIFYK